MYGHKSKKVFGKKRPGQTKRVPKFKQWTLAKEHCITCGKSKPHDIFNMCKTCRLV